MSCKPNLIPLSLYIHFPWCIRKCPYCDFNSYALRKPIDESAYIDALLKDLDQDLKWVQDRGIISIFMGGGTPSLFSANSMHQLMNGIRQRLNLSKECEVTMELNPGGVEHDNLPDYLAAGINRLSIGIQSFHQEHLKKIGRIHSNIEAIEIVGKVKQAGFNNINLDLMYALPQQTLEQALEDLQQAIALNPQHLSWYHLTIEPNTEFYRNPPSVPDEDLSLAIELAGKTLLQQHHFTQYEISAYSRENRLEARHNKNYWEFGDYLGIGAGAHSKITNLHTGEITRYSKHRTPGRYLSIDNSFISNHNVLSEQDKIIEFLFNALRLTKGFSLELFYERTYLNIDLVIKRLEKAEKQGFLLLDSQSVTPSKLGLQFLNELLKMLDA